RYRHGVGPVEELMSLGNRVRPETCTVLPLSLSGIGEALHARFPEVIACYLFGSRADGKARPDSDIDLAVFTAPVMPCTLYHVLAYYAPLSVLCGTDKIDLVWLNQAPLSLQWTIVSTGIQLFCCDTLALADFIEQTARVARDCSYYARRSQTWYRAF